MFGKFRTPFIISAVDIGGDGKAEQVFRFGERCRWQNVLLQTFELELENPEDKARFQYCLVIEHTKDGDKARIKAERLLRDQKLLFQFEAGNVQLYRDDGLKGPAYPFDWSQSGLATILPRDDNQSLTWFKQAVQRMVIVQVIPAMMEDEAGERGEAIPTKYLENFASWYRQISQEQGVVVRLTQSLQEVLEILNLFASSLWGRAIYSEPASYFKAPRLRFLSRSASYQMANACWWLYTPCWRLPVKTTA